jgi:hypothetical protein
MKIISIIPIFGILFCLLLFTGCTGTSPPVPATVSVQTPTPALTTEAIRSPTPTPVPFPHALAMNEYAGFGSGEKTGKATVLRYDSKPNYNWTAPSFNSAHEQAASSGPYDTQYGYNTEKPKDGYTFLFVYVRVTGTGNKAVSSPSALQFVMNIDGKTYQYTPVHSSDVIIDKVSDMQYDYQIGQGGAVGYVQPGESNSAEWYLIYEVPANFSPDTSYIVANLDYQNQAVWKLA